MHLCKLHKLTLPYQRHHLVHSNKVVVLPVFLIFSFSTGCVANAKTKPRGVSGYKHIDECSLTHSTRANDNQQT